MTSLKAERPFVKEAFRRLRGRHAAQVTLATILCGTRFKYSYQSLLLPTECPNRRQGKRMCGREDFFAHLLRRHRLERHWGTGVDSIELMVKMAIRATPESPGVNIPKYIL